MTNLILEELSSNAQCIIKPRLSEAKHHTNLVGLDESPKSENALVATPEELKFNIVVPAFIFPDF
jgi:hypothetical protein